MKPPVVACLLAALFALPAFAQANPQDGLFDLYKKLHASPELSHFEVNTSALLAAELRKAGYKVTERVGKYADGSQAYGVVAIMENGPGPRLLIRADMDGLPIREETGASYASTVLTKTKSGEEVGVMHACGHDIHMASLVGTARALAANKAKWHGTVMLIGQPSEETLDGARAMLADGLYERFGQPDMAIGLHDTPALATGTVGLTAGPAYAAVTSIDVTIRGVGGHGARPHVTRDPIVMAAQFINQLQTIVSRQQNPVDPAVVTVGSIHGGTKRNIISDEVKLTLTTRAFSERAMKIIVEGVRNAARGVGISAGMPEDRMPVVTIIESETGPATINNAALAAKVKATLVGAMGAKLVFDTEAAMASEDFGLYGLDGHQIPTLYFNVGVADAAALARAAATGTNVPGPHTSKFLPVAEPALKAGVTATTAVAMSLLQPSR